MIEDLVRVEWPGTDGDLSFNIYIPSDRDEDDWQKIGFGVFDRFGRNSIVHMILQRDLFAVLADEGAHGGFEGIAPIVAAVAFQLSRSTDSMRIQVETPDYILWCSYDSITGRVGLIHQN